MKIYILVLMLLAAGCSPRIQSYVDYDPDHPVQNYNSYRWLVVEKREANETPLYHNELNDKRIKDAVDRQFKMKGYRMEKDGIGLVVHYHIIVENKSVIYTDGYGYRYGPFWLKEERSVHYYQQGTLIIDIMDASSDELIWRGWASGVLDYDSWPEDADERINNAIATIFKKLPETVNLPDVEIIINSKR